MNSVFNPPYIYPDVVQEYNNNVQVRRLGHTSCDYRRSHIEVWVYPLQSGQSILNIPIIADAQGTIKGIRVRSKSDNLKITLMPTNDYEIGKDIHPRAIIFQQIFTERDTILGFENLYVFIDDASNENQIKTFLSIENLGTDSEGVSVVITFGY